MSKIMLTYNMFTDLYPRAMDPLKIHQAMEEMFPPYNVTTKPRIAGFVSQVGHESAGFTAMEENLNYSASALRRVFGRYFRRVDPNAYARQPQKIANRVYGGRMGNGPESSGDGWKFRGRGFIQLTGKNNYTMFANDMNMSIDEAIQYLQTIEGAVNSALWYWYKNDLNRYCDNYDVMGLTRAINGGYNGLDDRKKYWSRAINIMSGETRTNTTKTLKYGDTGPEVAKMQKALNLYDDGIFGSGTERAVKRFQKRNRLAVDGIAGPNTLAALYG